MGLRRVARDTRPHWAKKRPASGKPARGNGTPAKRRDEKPAKPPAIKEDAGFLSRRLALQLVENVLLRRRPFDDALADSYSQTAYASLEPRDRAFARRLSATVLRRHGQLSALVSRFLDKPLPEDGARARLILLVGAAQLVCLEAPPHAAINTAVDLCRTDRRSARFRGLVNAVLRRVSELDRTTALADITLTTNVPAWMLESWTAAYGAEMAEAIARSSLEEPALDLCVKSDPEDWAQRLEGTVLATGTVRLNASGRVDALDGYADGAWWIQDVAATLPARLFGSVEGLRIADLCAAPGGKTAQLAAAGASVTAVDISESRLATLTANLQRLGLDAQTVCADIRSWQPDTAPGTAFDGILLDAPCSATGTIRRHPDILHLKSPDDVASLSRLQAEFLDHVATLLRPGATLIYCTCSLQPEEGPLQIDRLLAARPELMRRAIAAEEVAGLEHLITEAGDLRTLPCLAAGDAATAAGMDGFYACRLVRRG